MDVSVLWGSTGNNHVGMWNVDYLHCEFYPHPVWIWKKLAAVCISQTKYGSYGVAGEIFMLLSN